MENPVLGVRPSRLVSQKPLEPELCEMAEESSAVEVHDRHAICNIIWPVGASIGSLVMVVCPTVPGYRFADGEADRQPPFADDFG